MGKRNLDQFTYLHFASGIIAYFWGVSLSTWMIFHFAFEMAENTGMGMMVINKYLKFWPGGKPHADSLVNIVGDNIDAALGWMSAYYLDEFGTRMGWYKRHIKI